MKTIVPPITMQYLNLDLVVADRSLLLSASIHVALSFAHIDPIKVLRLLEHRQHGLIPKR